MAGEAKTLYVRLAANITGYTTGMSTAAAVTDKFDHHLTAAGKSAGNLGKLAGGVGKAGVVSLVVSLTAAIAQAAQFERNMRNVNSISKLSEQALKTLSGQVLDLSRGLPQSAKELSQGLYDIASSGFQGADGLKVLQASATAASAGLSSTQTAAKGITAILNAYGKSAGDATDISDILFQTVNLGVVSFDELASTVGDFVGTAAAAGVPIEDASAALATMTLSGVSAAESGTSLNRVLQSLIDPSASLGTLFAKLGYESGEAALKQDGLHGVMEKIRVATGGNVTALLKLFPEIRAARGAFALMSAEGTNYTKVAGQIENANARAGATAKALAEQSKGVAFQFEVMRNKANAGLIQIGSKILPEVAAAMAAVTANAGDFVDTLGNGLEHLRPLAEAVADHLGNLADILLDVGQSAAPIAEDIAKIGGSTVIGALTLMMKTMAAVSGFLADHKALVYAVAAVYVSTLIPAAVAAGRVMLWKNILSPLVLGLVNLIGALGGAATAYEGVTTAAAAAAAAQTVASLGLTVLIAGLAAYAMAAGKAEARAERLFDTIEKGFDPSGKQVSSLQDLEDQYVALLDKQTAARDAAMAQIDSYRGLGGAFATVARGLTPMTNNLQDATAAFHEAEKRIADVEAKAATFSTNLQTLSDKFHISKQEAFELSKKLGVDLTGSTKDVTAAAGDYAAMLSDTANPATAHAAAAFDTLADAAATTEEKIKALKAAFDALTGVHLNAEAANSKLEESFDAIVAKAQQVAKGHREIAYELDQSTGKLKLNTKEQREGAASVRNTVEAILGLATSMREEGVSRDKVASTVAGRIKRLKDELISTGLTKAQVDKLIESYGLVPKDVTTAIKASGADATEQDLKDVKTAGDSINATPITPKVTIETKQAQNAIDLLKRGLNWLDRFIARPQVAPSTSLQHISPANRDGHAAGGRITGPGTSTSDSIPAWLSNDEYVFKASTARAIGYQRLDRWNAMGAVGYAAGGVVRPSYVTPDSVLTAVMSVQDKKGNPLPFSGARFEAELRKQLQAQELWRHQLARITRLAGQDVADALAAMGEQGTALVARMATGTTGQVRVMAADFRRLLPPVEKAKSALQEWSDGLAKTSKETRQFDRDLATLEKRGAKDVAAALREMGPEAGAAIARQAATASAKALAGISRSLPKVVVETVPAALSVLEEWTQGLEKASAAQAEFNANLDRIGLHGSPDIVTALKDMGVEAGGPIAAALAWADPAVLARVSAALPKLAPVLSALDEYQQGLHKTVDVQRQFNADLLTLIQQGRSDLASAFLDLGAETAGSLARQAVGASGAALAQLSSDVAAQAQLAQQIADMPQLLKLMSLLKDGAGLKALVDGSGIDIPTTLGLLEKYRTMIDTLPSGSLAAINADLAAINSGRQPKGYALGGIAPEGQLYRYAERGTGGEVNIPRRGISSTRAATLLQAAGAPYGMSMAGGGVQITVGEIVVETQPGMDPHAIADLVDRRVGATIERAVRMARGGKRA